MMIMKFIVKPVLAFFLATAALVAGADAAHATFPGSNGSITFSLKTGSTTDIYTTNPDGSARYRITNGPAGSANLDPAFSKGSERIVYWRQNPALGPGNGRIHSMNSDGTNDVTLTPDGQFESQPSFSPDGTKITYVSHEAGTSGVWMMDADGSNRTSVFPDCCAAYPAFSPDGTNIAWYSQDQVNYVPVHTLDGWQVAAFADPDAGRPSWSPDGSRIAFPAYRPGFDPDTPGIRSVPAARMGDSPTQLVSRTSSGLPTSPVYSPDGSSLAYLFNPTQAPAATLPYTPSGHGMNITDLTSGQTSLVDEIGSEARAIDWGSGPFVKPPPACKVRFSKARIFVFRRKPVYRLVARYWSPYPGQVKIDFFARNENGTRGGGLGSVSREFTAEGKFTIEKRVSESMATKLRSAKFGYTADVSIPAVSEFCDMSYSVEMSVLRHVKKQFVWFQPN